MVGDNHGREFDFQGTLESPNQESTSHARTIQRVRKFLVCDQRHQLEADLHWNDPSNSLVGVRIRMERPEGLGEGV